MVANATRLDHFATALEKWWQNFATSIFLGKIRNAVRTQENDLFCTKIFRISGGDIPDPNPMTLKGCPNDMVVDKLC